MANIFHPDFRDFIDALNINHVDYLLVGGYAVIVHGFSRTTGDLDIWVKRTTDNYKKLENAFLAFGMPMFDMTLQNFLNHQDWDVFRFGRKPVAIDIMVKMADFDFDECAAQATWYKDEELQIRLLNYNHLIAAKKAAGRNRDLNDLENLLPD